MKTISLRPLVVLFAAAAGLLLLGSSCKLANKAPAVPTLFGPTTGVAGVAITFTATATDPESDSLQFLFDWGDGATPAWTAFVASGDTVTATNTYSDSGTFTVKARAKDKSGKESDWSAGKAISVAVAAAQYPDSLAGSSDVPSIRSTTFSLDGSELYVLDYVDNCLLILRTSDMAVIDTVPTPGWPDEALLSRDGQYVFIMCRTGDSLLAVRTSDHAVTSATRVGALPNSLAADHAGNRLFVSCADEDSIAVVSTGNLAVERRMYFDSPGILAVAASDSVLYVTRSSTTKLFLVDIPSLSVMDSVSWASAVAGLVALPGGTRILVLDSDRRVSVYNVQTRTIETTIEVGLGPAQMALVPNTSVVLVTCIDGLRAVDIQTGQTLANLNPSHYVDRVCVSVNGDRACASGLNTGARLYVR